MVEKSNEACGCKNCDDLYLKCSYCGRPITVSIGKEEAELFAAELGYLGEKDRKQRMLHWLKVSGIEIKCTKEK